MEHLELEHMCADASHTLGNRLILGVVVDKVTVWVQQVRNDTVVHLRATKTTFSDNQQPLLQHVDLTFMVVDIMEQSVDFF